MGLDGVFLGEKDGVVPPCHPLPSDLLRQADQGAYALVDGRHPGFHILPVSGDGVVEVRVEAVRDLVQPGQDRRVVLGAEHHAIHLVRCQLVACDLVGEQGVAREDVTLGEAVEQPFRVVLNRVGASAGVDYRFYQSSVTMMATVNLGCALDRL